MARAVASAEARFSGPQEAARYEAGFYRMMKGLEFLPNSPTLMNAGTEIGQLAEYVARLEITECARILAASSIELPSLAALRDAC